MVMALVLALGFMYGPFALCLCWSGLAGGFLIFIKTEKNMNYHQQASREIYTLKKHTGDATMADLLVGVKTIPQDSGNTVLLLTAVSPDNWLVLVLRMDVQSVISLMDVSENNSPPN